MTIIPSASSPAALSRMKSQRQRDTGPEMALRRELHRRGYRYRVQARVLDGRRRHDMVFASARVVVEVRGCFWHLCPEHGSIPKANGQWWQDKLNATRKRDLDTERQLAEAGWTLVVIWEHDDPIASSDRVEKALERSPRIRSSEQPCR
jgi:DNA mismatch endonuclease (patch repair protein)